jgi:4-carboxymuconolactone decarboxylase
VATDPRLDLRQRTTDDTEGDVQTILGRLETTSNALKVVRLIANSPTVFKPFVSMASALMARASLGAAEREVVILYLAGHRGVPYEWAEHVPMSAAVGISDTQREALAHGMPSDLSLFDDSQRLALTAAGEINEQHSLEPATFERACRLWGEQAALDLIFTVAWWGGFVPTVIEAFGLESPQ